VDSSNGDVPYVDGCCVYGICVETGRGIALLAPALTGCMRSGISEDVDEEVLRSTPTAAPFGLRGPWVRMPGGCCGWRVLFASLNSRRTLFKNLACSQQLDFAGAACRANECAVAWIVSSVSLSSSARISLETHSNS